MRFVSFKYQQTEGLGVLDGSTLKGFLKTDAQFPADLVSIISKGSDEIKKVYQLLLAGNSYNTQEIQFLPPIANAGKVICVGLNYHDHSAESGFKQPDYPTIFGRFNSSLIGHEAAIIRPNVSEQLDYEGELVAVIGKKGKNIPLAEALDYVMGYSIFNDASIRDYQFKAPQWTMGKNFDGTGAFGPCLVTADELPLGGKGLKLETRLNGVVLQSTNTSDMVFDIATLVSVLSEALTLEPGDLIVSGTPSGVGLARKPQIWMKPGDICEVEIEHIGILSNTIAQEV